VAGGTGRRIKNNHIYNKKYKKSILKWGKLMFSLDLMTSFLPPHPPPPPEKRMG